MTTTSIPALLEPIQERLDAITPGKWFREYGDVITSDPDPRDVEEGYDDPRSMRIVRAAPHLNKREPQGIKNADFIANAPTDTARLLAAVKAVVAESGEVVADSEGLGLDFKEDDFDRGYHAARRQTVQQILEAVEAALRGEA